MEKRPGTSRAEARELRQAVDADPALTYEQIRELLARGERNSRDFREQLARVFPLDAAEIRRRA